MYCCYYRKLQQMSKLVKTKKIINFAIIEISDALTTSHNNRNKLSNTNIYYNSNSKNAVITNNQCYQVTVVPLLTHVITDLDLTLTWPNLVYRIPSCYLTLTSLKNLNTFNLNQLKPSPKTSYWALYLLIITQRLIVVIPLYCPTVLN